MLGRGRVPQCDTFSTLRKHPRKRNTLLHIRPGGTPQLQQPHQLAFSCSLIELATLIGASPAGFGTVVGEAVISGSPENFSLRPDTYPLLCGRLRVPGEGSRDSGPVSSFNLIDLPRRWLLGFLPVNRLDLLGGALRLGDPQGDPLAHPAAGGASKPLM